MWIPSPLTRDVGKGAVGLQRRSSVTVVVLEMCVGVRCAVGPPSAGAEKIPLRESKSVLCRACFFVDKGFVAL